MLFENSHRVCNGCNSIWSHIAQSIAIRPRNLRKEKKLLIFPILPTKTAQTPFFKLKKVGKTFKLHFEFGFDIGHDF